MTCQCFAHCEADCVCDHDWTPPIVKEMREKIERLRAENEALNSACAVGVRWNDLLADRLARNQSKRKAK